MTPRELALAQLESAARNLARSRSEIAALWERQVNMPPCRELEDDAPCWACNPKEKESWCDECRARTPLVEARHLLRVRHGGYMRAILAAARKLEREP